MPMIYHSDVTNKFRIFIDKLYPSKEIRICRIDFRYPRLSKTILKDYEFVDIERAIETFVDWRKTYQGLETSDTIRNAIRIRLLDPDFPGVNFKNEIKTFRNY